MSTTPQVLPWHREAAICIMGLNYPPGDAVANIAHIIAVHHWSHDPHAETVRLLGEALTEIILTDENGDVIHANVQLANTIRAHLTKLRGA